MSKVYQLLEQYYDEYGYTDIRDIVLEMYSDGVITGEQYEDAKRDDDLYYDFMSLVEERKPQCTVDYEDEVRDLERWYRNNV